MGSDSNEIQSPESGDKTIEWQFPLPRTHTGVLVGNGTQGLMIWGQDNQLNVTIARAGFWDRRGGNEFKANSSFAKVREMLEAYDEEAVVKEFTKAKKSANEPNRSYQLGGGRLEVRFPEKWILQKAMLGLRDGRVSIAVSDENGVLHCIGIEQAVYEEKSRISLPDGVSVDLALIPSYDHPQVKDRVAPIGVAPPERWKLDDASTAGFIQRLPEDEPLAICYKKSGNEIVLATALGENADGTAKAAVGDYQAERIRKMNLGFWEEYWSAVPDVRIPDEVLQETYDYGLYKQAASTPPHGVACTLQGPFMEEYQLPPWSNDYHFNINIQMIYWPVLATNRLQHLDPMWQMVLSWLPQMRHNGALFYDNENALLMPHAVDDECQIVGNFWTGMIDQACAAWVAHMAWMHYRYSMDEAILEEIAYPLMVGTFEGYWSMLEEVDDGEGGVRHSLPVSVSPEFRGRRIDAWGRDASFQLAALHKMMQTLPKAAALLGERVDERWRDVEEGLAPYSVVRFGPNGEQKRIALWEGMDLIESHRHHSHLAALYPFDTIDAGSKEHASIVSNSIRHWVGEGPGIWSGWCVPWASILHNRVGNAEAAISWLHYWHRNFVNEGRGTLHDAAFSGISWIGRSRNMHKIETVEENFERMQLDAGFGAIDAIHHFLVQQRGEVLHVVPSIPRDWDDFGFERIRVEGAFQITARVEDRQRKEIVVKSLAGGSLRLAHYLGEACLADGKRVDGEVIELSIKEGDSVRIQPIHGL